MLILPDKVYTICWVTFSLLPLCFCGTRKVNFQVQQGLIHACTELLFLIVLIIVILKKERGKNPGRQTASTAGTAGELNCRFVPSIDLTLYQTLSIVI